LSQQDAEKTCAGIRDEKVEVIAQVKEFPEFLAKVQQEMKLVHRPSWQQVRSTTLAVMVFVFLFALYLQALDWILAPLDRWLFVH
jgi:preprotein translocase SecE subunit